MAWWGYIEWYNRRPVWLRVLLVPIVMPVMLVQSTIAIAFFVIVLSFAVVHAWISNRRFWRKLRKRGQVAQWPEVERKVTSGSGTLIVEVTPKGPGCAWLIDVPRDVVDPGHIVPPWQRYEELGWDLFDFAPAAFESVNRWSMERLGAYELSARAVVPSWEQLSRLGVEAKQQSVLALLCLCEGCLTSRCNGRARRDAPGAGRRAGGEGVGN